MKAAEKKKQQLPILRLTLKDTLLVLRSMYKNSTTARYQSFRTPLSSSTAVIVSATLASSAGLIAVVSSIMSTTTASIPSSTFIIETASGTSGKKQSFSPSHGDLFTHLSANTTTRASLKWLVIMRVDMVKTMILIFAFKRGCNSSNQQKTNNDGCYFVNFPTVVVYISVSCWRPKSWRSRNKTLHNCSFRLLQT